MSGVSYARFILNDIHYGTDFNNVCYRTLSAMKRIQVDMFQLRGGWKILMTEINICSGVGWTPFSPNLFNVKPPPCLNSLLLQRKYNLCGENVFAVSIKKLIHHYQILTANKEKQDIRECVRDTIGTCVINQHLNCIKFKCFPQNWKSSLRKLLGNA